MYVFSLAICGVLAGNAVAAVDVAPATAVTSAVHDYCGAGDEEREERYSARVNEAATVLDMWPLNAQYTAQDVEDRFSKWESIDKEMTASKDILMAYLSGGGGSAAHIANHVDAKREIAAGLFNVPADADDKSVISAYYANYNHIINGLEEHETASDEQLFQCYGAKQMLLPSKFEQSAMKYAKFDSRDEAAALLGVSRRSITPEVLAAYRRCLEQHERDWESKFDEYVSQFKFAVKARRWMLTHSSLRRAREMLDFAPDDQLTDESVRKAHETWTQKFDKALAAKELLLCNLRRQRELDAARALGLTMDAERSAVLRAYHASRRGGDIETVHGDVLRDARQILVSRHERGQSWTKNMQAQLDDLIAGGMLATEFQLHFPVPDSDLATTVNMYKLLAGDLEASTSLREEHVRQALLRPKRSASSPSYKEAVVASALEFTGTLETLLAAYTIQDDADTDSTLNTAISDRCQYIRQTSLFGSDLLASIAKTVDQVASIYRPLSKAWSALTTEGMRRLLTMRIRPAIRWRRQHGSGQVDSFAAMFATQSSSRQSARAHQFLYKFAAIAYDDVVRRAAHAYLFEGGIDATERDRRYSALRYLAAELRLQSSL